MYYTVRFAHMAEPPEYAKGDRIKRGDIVGIMGNTGLSTGAHLHIDVVEGWHDKPYQLKDIGTSLKPSRKQLELFIDDELFGIFPVVTTKYLDAEYKVQFGKDHPAIDCVPSDRQKTNEHFPIHWNRSMNGMVTLVVNQPKGYGHCMYVAFEVKG